jgi:hypothetical protein
MSKWNDRVRKHEIVAQMERFGSAIDEAIKVPGISPATVEDLERLRSVLTYVGKRLAAADPMLVPLSSIQNLAAAFNQASSNLDSFVQNRNEGHIGAANNILDEALHIIQTIPGAYSPDEFNSLMNSVERYREILASGFIGADKSVKDFNGRVASLSEDLDGIASDLEREHNRLNQITTDYQGQFSASQERRNSEFTAVMASAQEAVSRLSSDYQAQFSSAQELRSKEFAAGQNDRQTRFYKLEQDYKDRVTAQDAEHTNQLVELTRSQEPKIGDLYKQYASEGNVFLDTIKERQIEVEKVVGVIGNLATTSGYLKAANGARRGMWLWQTFTMVAMVVLCRIAYKTLWVVDGNGHHDSFYWASFSSRLVLLLSLGAIAAYSANQADKLFTDEKRNRKLALELEAIGPYLAPLPIDEQTKFRVLMGERTFGKDIEALLTRHKKSPVTAVDLVALLKSKEGQEFADLVIGYVKKAK